MRSNGYLRRVHVDSCFNHPSFKSRTSFYLCLVVENNPPGTAFNYLGTRYETDRRLLAYNGRIVNDDRTLEDINVEDGKLARILCKAPPSDQTIVIPLPVVVVSCFDSGDLRLAFQPPKRRVSLLMILLEFNVVDCQDKFRARNFRGSLYPLNLKIENTIAIGCTFPSARGPSKSLNQLGTSFFLRLKVWKLKILELIVAFWCPETLLLIVAVELKESYKLGINFFNFSRNGSRDVTIS